ELRKDINVLFSETDLIRGTIMENITLGRKIDYTTIDKLATVTGLKKYIVITEGGYEKMIQPSSYHLPDSVIQKILLTRILASQPKLMLLEAPFEKIAQGYREEILSYIRDNMKETTVIVTGYECTRTDLF